jgi:hypothetical protein
MKCERCGLPMACINSRPWEQTDRRVVRLRVYRCQCGATEATIELRSQLERIRTAIYRAEKRQKRRGQEGRPKGEAECKTL